MTAVASPAPVRGGVAALASAFVQWLETGVRSGDLFAPDVFVDLTTPRWRVQAEGTDAAYGLREGGHPFPGEVRAEGLDATTRGFLLQFEERWEAEGQRWYSRELVHAVVTDGRIGELVVFCTGDWDQARQRLHASRVRLLRP